MSERYPGAPEHIRIFSLGIFERVHHDQSVGDLAHLADMEDDFGLRGQLGVALASHFDGAGIEPALEIYREAPSDPEHFTIIERLFAHTTLADIELAEKQGWERRIKSHRRQLQASLPEVTRTLESIFQSDDDWPDEEWLDDDRPDDDSNGVLSLGVLRSQEATGPGDDDWRIPPLQPFVDTSPRVGRNEPCPCGSGKKYKQCCLRKAPK